MSDWACIESAMLEMCECVAVALRLFDEVFAIYDFAKTYALHIVYKCFHTLSYHILRIV